MELFRSDIEEAIIELKNNKAVILPTETVYGLFILESTNQDVIYDLKNRDKSKKLCKYIINTSENINLFRPYHNYLPGPFTFIKNNLGYRISSNFIINTIIKRVGPLYGTSANISGSESKTKIDNNELNVYTINSGPTFLGVESIIVNLDTNQIIRNNCKMNFVI